MGRSAYRPSSHVYAQSNPSTSNQISHRPICCCCCAFVTYRRRCPFTRRTVAHGSFSFASSLPTTREHVFFVHRDFALAFLSIDSFKFLFSSDRPSSSCATLLIRSRTPDDWAFSICTIEICCLYNKNCFCRHTRVRKPYISVAYIYYSLPTWCSLPVRNRTISCVSIASCIELLLVAPDFYNTYQMTYESQADNITITD